MYGFTSPLAYKPCEGGLCFPVQPRTGPDLLWHQMPSMWLAEGAQPSCAPLYQGLQGPDSVSKLVSLRKCILIPRNGVGENESLLSSFSHVCGLCLFLLLGVLRQRPTPVERFGPLQRTSVLGDAKDTAAQREQGKTRFPLEKCT